MDVEILGNKKSFTVTSVIITTPKDGFNDLHMFFCYNCKNPLFQYKGRVVSITSGSTPHTVPIILKCSHCKTAIQVVDIL